MNSTTKIIQVQDGVIYAGFDSIIVLLGLLVIPALYLIYNQMIKKRRKAAIKFSNLMFVKSAISTRKNQT